MKKSIAINQCVTLRKAQGAPIPLGTGAQALRGIAGFWAKRGIDPRRKYYGKIRGKGNDR